MSIINNYVEKEDVYYFTRKQPLEKEAKLPSKLAKPIHKLFMVLIETILESQRKSE